MRVSELWRYPVKSMAGERLTEATLSSLGIPGDRELVVMDGVGRVLSARATPKLLRLSATLGAGDRVRVNGRDWESPEVAAQVRDAAGAATRLTAVHGPERFDIMPLLVATDGAIEVLGVDHRRLRPNLVIGGVHGLTERDWQGHFLEIGEGVIGLADLRGRCIMTTFDPDTGAQDLGVLMRIREEFDGTFALNAWVARSGRIAVGDAVRVLDSFEGALAPVLGRLARR